jgi:hypothetical protein
MVTTPSRQGQQRHCNDGKDACALMMTMMSLQQGQQCQLEDRQCHCNEGNNTIADQEQWCHYYKGDDTSSMTARTLCSSTTAIMPLS